MASMVKYSSELNFWKGQMRADPYNIKRYVGLFLKMAEEENDEFLNGKVVADFGCGPCGSLSWVKGAALMLGIDVLAAAYGDTFKKYIVDHNMVYVQCTEQVIPIPNEFVDVMFTLNAVDHVDHLEIMCDELLRVIKPGGELIASFNINEPPSPTEPQMLTEEIIDKLILSKMEVKSLRLSKRELGAENEWAEYQGLYDGNETYEKGENGFIWVKATKR